MGNRFRDWFRQAEADLELASHTLTALAGRMPDSVRVPEDVSHAARVLDKHYIPTRYPNGFDSGAPTDFYTKEEAEDALQKAGDIIEFCRNQIDGPGEGESGGS